MNRDKLRFDKNSNLLYVTMISTMLLIMCGFSLICCSQEETKKSFGIDISHHNGEIDWGIVPSVDFVYIKATEGATYIDPMYKINLKGAKSRKYKVGAYHYFGTSSSAIKQFENFRKQVKRTDVDLIPVVDVEECKNWSPQQFRDSLEVFAQLIKSHYGVSPMIYSVNSFYNKYCAPHFNRYHLMIGRYGDFPPFIKGKVNYTIWQRSEKGKVKGVPKPVDINYFNPKYTIDHILMK